MLAVGVTTLIVVLTLNPALRFVNKNKKYV